ncbi:MAG: PCRF domain-containing protein, partial [Methylococcales bacterium]|nr:PCRF domain-containing protein [Methylococcales bacterium]
MKTSIQHKLDHLSERFHEIAALLSQPEIQGDQDRFRSLGQEYAQLEPIVDCFQQYQANQKTIEGAKEMAHDSDPDMREMAKE